MQTFRSFEEAERADVAYYRALTPSQRLAILLELVREGQSRDEVEPGLARVYRIVELAQS
jgi:hypothetical protein